MNKKELKELLVKTWSSNSSVEDVFLLDLNSKNLTAQKLIQCLESPKADFPRYNHPELKRPLALIQEFTPLNILTAMFSAWGQGDDALILDPKLSADQTQSQLQKWGLTPTSSRPEGSINGPLSIALATSGSSGSPKLIGLSADQMNNSCRMAREFLAEDFPRSWGLSLPCWHIGGLMVLWRMLVTKGKVVELELKNDLPHKGDPQLQALSLVPTQLQRLMDQGQSHQLSKLSLILLGGAACPSGLIEQSLHLKLPVYLSYGSTETCSMIAAAKVTQASKGEKLSTLPSVHLKTSSEQRLQISSPTLHSWRIEGEELITQAPGSFYTTQDRAKLNGEKELEILGRVDRTFISGGENVSPEKIENLATEHPLIQQALVLIRPDEEYGQVSHLTYQPQQNAGPDIEFQIIEFLKENLQGFEVPKSLSLMPQYSTLKPPRSFWQDQINQQYSKYKNLPGFLFLHGFMGLPDEFLLLKRELEQKGIPAWKIKSLRLPGHDGLQLNENASTSESLDVFNQELKRQLQTPQIVYAYSMGARVLSMWLHHSPEQRYLANMKGLILESGHPGGLSSDQAKKRAKADAEIFNPQSLKLESFLKKWTQLSLFEGLAQLEVVSKLSKIKASRHDPQQLYASLQSLSVSLQPDVKQTWHDLSQEVPVLYLSGAKDQKYTKIGQELKMTHQVHPWASHNIHLQDPDWCAQRALECFNQALSSSY